MKRPPEPWVRSCNLRLKVKADPDRGILPGWQSASSTVGVQYDFPAGGGGMRAMFDPNFDSLR